MKLPQSLTKKLPASLTKQLPESLTQKLPQSLTQKLPASFTNLRTGRPHLLSNELRHDTLRRAVAAVENAPGVRRTRRRVVRRIRASPRARRMAHQVFALGQADGPGAGGRDARSRGAASRGAGGRSAPTDLSAGSLLGGVGTESLRVVLIVMTGQSAQDVASVVEEVAELQLLEASFRPLFVFDTPAFAPVRRFGYPAELLIAEGAWDDTGSPWETYLRRRLASIIRFYRCSATVRPNSGQLHPVDRALLVGS